MSKFKVGDRVRVIKNGWGFSGKIGEIHTITGVSPVGYGGDEGYQTNTSKGHGIGNGWISYKAFELVVEELSPMEESINSLVFLEEVGSAHKGEQDGWFSGLRELVGKVDHTDFPVTFFEDYERIYKDKANVKAMPTTYRTAKSALINANKYSILAWGNEMGKSAIEKAVKEARKAEAKTDPTPEQLLGTIIKACDTIKIAYEALDHEHQVKAEKYIEAIEDTL